MKEWNAFTFLEKIRHSLPSKRKNKKEEKDACW
jgi:hypothetical protein